MSIIYGWLWSVMAGYEVLFGFRYQIQTACRRPRRSPGPITLVMGPGLLLGRRQWPWDYNREHFFFLFISLLFVFDQSGGS